MVEGLFRITVSRRAVKQVSMEGFPVCILFYLRRCDCTSKVRDKIEHMKNILLDHIHFKSVYRYAYDFAKVSSAYVFRMSLCHLRSIGCGIGSGYGLSFGETHASNITSNRGSDLV